MIEWASEAGDLRIQLSHLHRLICGNSFFVAHGFQVEKGSFRGGSVWVHARLVCFVVRDMRSLHTSAIACVGPSMVNKIASLMV